MLLRTIGKFALVILVFLFSYSASAQNQALDLSGAGNEVNVTFDLNTVSGYTVEQWIFLPTVSSITSLTNQTSGSIAAPLDAYVNADGSVSMWLGNGTLSSQATTAPGVITNATWHHVAFVYDPLSTGSEGQIFIDGATTPSATMAEPAGFLNVGPLRIGVRADGNEGDDILIDEVRIWSIPRTGTAINTDFDAKLTGGETGLDVYLQFENNLNDDAANNGIQDGSLAAGSIGYVLGAPLQNNALNFDGLDDNVSLPRNTLPIGLTFEAWVNTLSADATSGYEGNAALSVIGDVDNNIRGSFGINGGLVSYFHWTGSGLDFDTIAAVTPINDGNWHHIAVTHDQGSNEVYIYVDGQLDGQGITTTYYADMSFNRIGSSYVAALDGDFFDGTIDEVRIWDNVRSQEQINADAFTTLSAGAGLIASYDFNQGIAGGDNGSYTSLPDLTINGNDGTLNGPFALNFAASNWLASAVPNNDVFPPFFLSGYPLIDNIGSTGFDITVQLNEPGTYFYVVVPDGATQPTVDDVRSGTGSGGTGEVDAGNIIVTTASTDFVLNATGLASGTDYDLYIVAQDDEGSPNVQGASSQFDVTTVSPPLAPTDLIAYASSASDITLIWTDNAIDETGYTVQRAVDYAFSAPLNIATGLPVNTTTYTDNAGTDQRFYYRVIPTNGNEDASSESSIEFGATIEFAGDALTFDGVDDRVSIADDDSLSFGNGTTDSPFSVEAWVNMDQVNSQGIISKRSGANEWHMVTSGTGQLSVTLADNSASAFLFGETTGFTFNTGQWYHVAFSYDGTGLASGIRLFIDGVEYANNASSSGPYTAMENTNSPLEIGTINSGVSFNFDGQIDEIKIWGFEKIDYSDRFSQPQGDEVNLISYYPLDEGAGLNVVDRSVNTNDGILQNGPIFNPSSVVVDGIVSNTNDAGPGSFREAINYANVNPGTTITFNIAGGGPYTIGALTSLPDITAAGTIIDGTSQPGWTFGDVNSMISIDGSAVPPNTSGIVINEAANVEIYGMIVTGFIGLPGHGAIELAGDGADNIIIGAPGMGNIIHGGGTSGIYITNSDTVTIQANRIGTIDGVTASGNNHHGISIVGTVDNLTIGGNWGSNEGNVISGAGNGRYGILSTAQGTNFVIQGNRIGTNEAGTASIFNEGGGVNIGGATSLTLGGINLGEENIISGNNSDANATGVTIGTSPTGTIVNNIIGLTADGLAALGNGGAGLLMNTFNGIVVTGNIISGNAGDAITSNTGFSNSDIINNVIGLDVLMTNPIPNGAGIEFGTGTGNRIGYKDNPNIIAENTGAAIEISSTATENTFATNEIYNNGSGIILAAGANGDLAAPTIDNVSGSVVSGTGVEGGTIHLYLGDGAGQGQTFLDSTIVSGGTWTISGLSLLTTDEVVATATDYGAGLGTSAFSTAVSIPPSLVINTNDTGAGSLRDAITYANANPGTTITFDIAGAGPWTIVLSSALPQITANNTVIDGTTQPGWAFGDSATMVQISGSGIGGNANGINIDAANVEIYGLILTGFSGSSLNGNIYLASDAADNAILGGNAMGNIIHGSGGNAIYIVHGDSAVIRGNRIGTLDGSAASSIGDHGIATTGEIDDLIIGGDFFTGDGNTISGSGASRYGLNLFGSGGGTGLSNVTIAGNKIGTNDTADGAIPNGLGGINILGTVSAVEIGGPSPNDLNIISGNSDHGIIIQAGNTFDIDGNYIGLQSDGSSALGNAGSGIRINGAAVNVNIGTISQNIISENAEYGIVYDGNTSSNTALGTLNIFSCNVSGGIGYASGPLTPGGTIDDVNLTTAIVSTAAADGSTVFVYFADDGCSNNQGIALAGTGLVSSGQAIISGGFAPSSHYVALVEDINGFSEFSSPYFANFVMVTNTNDSGVGSFRAAIDSANMYPGASIYFNIPGGGPWDITLVSALPNITGQGTIIDATTQPSWDISTANIPRIIGNAGINIGLNFTSNFMEVYGLHISDFNLDGIRLNTVGAASNGYVFGAIGEGNILTGNGNAGIQILTYTGGGDINSNYIGILPDGTTASMSNGVGILLGTNADNAQIGGLIAGEANVISNNTNAEIRVANADFTTIQGNILGLDSAETTPVGASDGIDLTTATGVTIEQNVIAGHATGIRINNSSSNTIIRNNIGVASDGFTQFGNNDGIHVIDNLDSDNNIIGSSSNSGDGNIIANSINIGIRIDGAGNNGNQIQRNQIYNNSTNGISFSGGAQNGILPPTIDPIASANAVTGTGTNGDEIDLYLSDGTGQGDSYLGSAIVSGGVWSVGSLSLLNGEEVVATTTNALDGTSEFSTSQQFSFTYPSAEGAGEALAFDGTDDVVTIPNSGAFETVNYTLETWVSITSNPGNGDTDAFINKGTLDGSLDPNGYSMGYTFDGSNYQVFLGHVNGSNAVEALLVNYTLTIGQWYHVAGVYDGVDMILYVNGLEIGRIPAATPDYIGDATDIRLGGYHSLGGVSAGDFLNAQLDEVRIWDFAMPESSIREYLAEKVTNIHPSFSNLMAYYRMDDSGDALNLLDFKGAHNATISGGSSYTLSGAHLGDESFYEYTYSAGSGRNLDDFRVENLGTDNLPLHIYRIDQTPANNTISGFNNIDDTEYYGVFAPNQTYDVTDSIGGLTTNRRIVFRNDGADPTWTSISGPIGIDIQDDQIYAYGQQGNGQFATAIDQNPYPLPADAGYAMSFDGNDDINVLNVDLTGGPFTVETWFKTSQASPYLVVVNENGSLTNTYTLLNLNAGQVRFNFREPPSGAAGISLLSPSTYNDGEWHHAAGTYDGVNTITLYVDGVQVGQNSAVGASIGYNVDLSLGKNFPNATNQLTGELDEVRLWNVALSEKNIRDHMIGKLDADFDSLNHLVSYFRFDENSGATVANLAGDSDGTVTGATPVISGAPQGEGSIYSYVGSPGILNTAQFGEDINVHYQDATGGIHGYLVGGAPNQVQVDGYNDLSQGKYYGVFAPGQKVEIRMDYNNGGTYDPDRRIVYRTDASDTAAVGGWERLSGLINSDVSSDSIFAFNVPTGEVSVATLNPPSSYPILGDTDPGSALNFDGLDDQIQIADQEQLNFIQNTGNYTVEAWIKIDDLASNQAILGNTETANESGFFMYYWGANDGSIRITLSRSVAGSPVYTVNTDPNIISDNGWHHIAVVGSGSTAQFYIDGIAVNTNFLDAFTAFATGLSTNSELQLGSIVSNLFLNGDLDEVRIWKASVSAGDILAYANTTDIASHPNYTDMHAYYKFDEGTGSIVQDVFANNDGSWNGPSGANISPNWVASGALAGAPEQNALNFDGTDDNISFTRSQFVSGLTYEAWINTTSTENTSVYNGNPALTVIGDNDISVIGAFGVHDGKVRYTHWTGSGVIFDQIDGTATVNDGQWHHIAVSHENGSNDVRIYVDGILDTMTTSSTYNTGMSANRIGSGYLDGFGNDAFFDGSIDEVRIWDTIIPDGEIRDYLYSDDLSLHPSSGNLVLHYNFNQGIADGNNTGETAVFDQTINALDGALNGFALTGVASNFVASGNTSFSPVASTLQATNINTFAIMDNSVDVSWVNGDGQRRIVAVFEGIETEMPIPSDNQYFHADTIFGGGDIVDGSWYAVYNGYGNTVTIDGLTPGTDYTIAVLEVNGPPTFEAYNSGADVNNPVNFTTTGGVISNYAIEFDGTNEYLVAPDGPSLMVPTEITLEAWVKRTRLDTVDIILEKGGDWTNNETNYGMGLNNNANNNMFYFFWSGGGRGTNGVTDFNWHHYAVVAQEGNADPELYIDGVLQTIDITFGNGTIDLDETTTKDLHIGSQVDLGLNYYGANIIDEVRIWDYARSETEIQNHMNNSLFGNEFGLVAYYPMSDGVGNTTVTDLTGNGSNATLINMDANTDWVEGPSLSPPNLGSTLFEDFTDEPLPGTASSGPFIFDSGLWDGQGVLESGDIDARGGAGNAARVESGGGNYIQTPPLDQATTFGFWYKGVSTGGTYDIVASSDGGTTFDIVVGSINPEPTYQEVSIDFTLNFDPTYTGPVRIEFSGGSNPLFIDDVSADVDILRADVTIVTLPVGDASVNPGDMDIMIYKASAAIATADAYFEGLYLVPIGADSLDFELNGFDFYQNVGTDDFGSASLLGTSSWSPGDPVPGDAIGLLVNDTYSDGDTVYYYVTADISSTANSVTFNIDQPMADNFGFGESNKIDGGLAPGDNITILGGPDTTPPTVTNLSPSLGTIVDSDTQFDLTITFGEAMDTGIDPTISFTVEDPTNTLTFSGGLWDDSFNFTASYLVDDVDELLSNIDVQVTDAQDVAGNLMNTYDSVDVFNIDTENPTIAVDTYATSITSPQLTGTIDDANATIDIEVDGGNYSATNNGNGTWTLSAGLIASLTDGTYEVIATATDQSGNIGMDGTSNELIISQTVVTLPGEDVTSTSFTASWSEGLDVQTYQIDVSTVADFATFVSGFQGTQTTATSITVDNLDFSSEYYYRVRVVNTSSEVSDNSNTTVVKTIVDAETLADSTALRQLYAAVNPQGLNWETERLRDWIGVDLDPTTRTRVEIVDISGTSASGDMPNPFTAGAVGGLTNLLEMDASNNEITGLMDYSGTAINDLNVSDNSLEFDDLEPVAGMQTVDYSNQTSLQFNESAGAAIEVRYDTDYSLSASIGGSNNTYTWYRNDEQISSGDDFIVNNAASVILAIDYDNMGTFRVEVTSSLVPGLTIDVDAQDVLAIADMEVSVTDADGNPLTAPLNGYMLETTRTPTGFRVLETLEDVNASTFTFLDVVLGNYIIFVESDLELYIPTYFGDVFEWTEADTLFFRSDDVIAMKMVEVPDELGPGDGDGNLDVLIEEDFGDDGGRVEARRRASKRKCGLRRKRSGGRTGQDDDEFELIAYGETDDDGEFQFGFLPQGTYRFFVEYPGIPLDESSFVQFDVGEAGVSDTDFKLQAFATEDGIEVTIEAVLGVILEYFKDLEIYPNPSSEYLNIRYRHLKSGDVTAQLVNLAGNMLWSEDLRNEFDGQLRIDVANFEEGVYILRFYDRESPQDNVVSFRVIVKD